MNKSFILVKVFRPEEGYDDVHPELVLADFQENPKAFKVELIKTKFDPTVGVPVELTDAEQRVPYSTFVQSCRDFFEKKGFLSDNQRRALTFAGTPDRRNRQFGYDDYFEEIIYEDQF